MMLIVLVIGGGGAGASAALEAHNGGANVLVVTKLRMGDANTMMAEGGIQAADKGNDSPAQHYLDAFGGGHYKNIPELLEELVTNGPLAIDWLSKLGRYVRQGAGRHYGNDAWRRHEP